MTVNITCDDCDGLDLCAACRTAARTFSAAGHRIEHSTRYAALRAATAGAYGFEACVIPLKADERAVVDAAVALFADRKLAFVADDPSTARSAASASAVFTRAAYAAGEFDVEWLTRAPSVDDRTAADADSTAVIVPTPVPGPDHEKHAARRLKRIADTTRVVVATAGLRSAPRLDMLAVLDDEVAWARASSAPFAICLVHLPGLGSRRAGESAGAAETRVRDAEQIIAGAARASDIVSGRGDDFVIVLAESSTAGAEQVAARLRAAIAASSLRQRSKTKVRPRGFAAWSIGHAAFPDDGGTRDALLAHATATFTPM